MILSNNFELREFVDPDIYQMRGEKSAELIDRRIVDIAQAVRDHFGLPVLINNWHEGGGYKESGLRKFLTKTGAAFSQHKFGRAADLKLEGITDYEAVRREINRNWAFFKAAGLTTIEKDTLTWLHVDCRFTGLETLNEVPFQ